MITILHNNTNTSNNKNTVVVVGVDYNLTVEAVSAARTTIELTVKITKQFHEIPDGILFVLTTLNMSWYAFAAINFQTPGSTTSTPTPQRPTSPSYAHSFVIGKQPSTSTGINGDFMMKELRNLQ
ncbi:hypothetical protein DPMN_183065 [Dreissena polymorpha]|uniref:Uncharacterized protein n=1 Tax=Dreissena polymorpha TaxID=45954 RepID=A0A9D4DG17_DREPO|nr:hypothetical protein DPMN_183065 [Dreissena polymorpha]